MTGRSGAAGQPRVPRLPRGHRRRARARAATSSRTHVYDGTRADRAVRGTSSGTSSRAGRARGAPGTRRDRPTGRSAAPRGRATRRRGRGEGRHPRRGLLGSHRRVCPGSPGCTTRSGAPASPPSAWRGSARWRRYSALDNATFSRQGSDSRYLPLAFDHRLVRASQGSPPAASVSFVGARYPNRERVLETSSRAGVPVRAYGRDWSGHPVDRLRTWRLRRPDVPGEPRPRSRRGLRRDGRVDGNPQPARRPGRLHDAHLRGRRRRRRCSSIDRTDVGGLYEPGHEVLTWTDAEELVDLCQRAWYRPRLVRRRSARRSRAVPSPSTPSTTGSPFWRTHGTRSEDPGRPRRVAPLAGVSATRSASLVRRDCATAPPVERAVDVLRGGRRRHLVAVEATHASVAAGPWSRRWPTSPRERTIVVLPAGLALDLGRPPARTASAEDRLRAARRHGGPGSRSLHARSVPRRVALAARPRTPFLVTQHGALTPFAPPLPPDDTCSRGAGPTATTGRSGRADIDVENVGSQLLWRAGLGFATAARATGSTSDPDLPRPGPRGRDLPRPHGRGAAAVLPRARRRLPAAPLRAGPALADDAQRLPTSRDHRRLRRCAAGRARPTPWSACSPPGSSRRPPAAGTRGSTSRAPPHGSASSGSVTA